MTGLQYSIVLPWTGLSGGRSPFTGLRGREERFLCSPDSMTSLLEEIYGPGVEVAAVVRERRPLDPRSAAYLRASEGSEALVRGVWIRADERPLIFAFSLIPLETLERGLLQVLEANEPEPIGRTLRSQSVAFTKDAMEAGVIRCPIVAQGLGQPAETAYFARRYLLHGTKNDRLVIKAAITEVFGPELISAEHVRA